MAEWKKVVVSGSDISQLNNDVNYLIQGQDGAYLTGSFSGSFIGDFTGTASYATSASYANTATSASYAETATSASYSETATSSSYAETSTSASYAESSSYALSSSYADTATSASYAPSVSPFPYTGSAIISGSLEVIGLTTLYNSGSTVFEVSGSSGALFSIVDDLSGDIFTVSSGSIDLFNISSSGDAVLSGSLTVTGNIKGTGSLKLQPDSNDARYLEIYNTAAQDTHITASGGWLFLGDDTTYVKVDNYSTNNSMELRADNGISVTGSLDVTGSNINLITEQWQVSIDNNNSQIVFAQSGSSFELFDLNGSRAVWVDNRQLNNSNGDIIVDWENGLFSGSFSGSFQGDGSGLTNLPTQSFESNQIATGSVTGSVDVGSNSFTLVSESIALMNVRANGGFENGLNVTASGAWSHAEGVNTVASGNYSHAEGDTTTASGNYSHAEGGGTTASGYTSHAEGNGTTASGYASHAEGNGTIASGSWSHAEGRDATASGLYSHAEGYLTIASGSYSHAEGYQTVASAIGSHAEGSTTTASGDYSHAEGNTTTASGNYSHAEGNTTTASGNYSHAEGSSTTASGSYSHAEGQGTTASGNYSHAEGLSTTASGYSSHAEGQGTTASGNYSHAEGSGTIASGSFSHAEGDTSIALGDYSHAEGESTVAYGPVSHAEGLHTIASGSGQLAAGKYNTHNNLDSLVVIGNGVDDANRSDLALFNSQSITFNQPVTGSIFTGSFVGDGSGLTGISASYLASSASNGTGISTFTYNGTSNVTVEVSGASALSSNTLTKWTGDAFANTSITDDGTLVTFSTDALFQGDITVQGTASFQNVENLLVADRFVLFASGSNATGDGGIVVQQGTQNIGELYGYDSGVQRWGFTGSFDATSTSYAPEAYIAAVVDVDGGQSDIAKYQKNGNIRVSGSDIYIYA